MDLELAHTSPTPNDQQSFQRYSDLVRQLAGLNEKTELLELTFSVNSGRAGIAIQTPDAESYPIVQLLKDEALGLAGRLDEVVRIC